MAFRVLFVCTGNVCRSPTAELAFERAAGSRAAAVSAGIAARVGDRIDPPTAVALARLGFDPSLHRARRFTTTLAQGADLVLAADVAQRDRIMLELPTAFRRTFTLKEFVRTATTTEAPNGSFEHAGQVVAAVSRTRGAARSTDPRDDDIADPYEASDVQATAAVHEIIAYVEALVRLLRVQRPRPSVTTGRDLRHS